MCYRFSLNILDNNFLLSYSEFDLFYNLFKFFLSMVKNGTGYEGFPNPHLVNILLLVELKSCSFSFPSVYCLETWAEICKIKKLHMRVIDL